MNKLVSVMWIGTFAFGLGGCVTSGPSSTQRSIREEGPTCVGARTPGFWCENQDGGNPNLTAEEFDELADEAADLLGAVPSLDEASEIAAAICDTSDQLERHLAALALNLSANIVGRDTPYDGDYATVGAAFDAAIAVMLDASATADEREAVKDALDEINNNDGTTLADDCDETPAPYCGDGTVDAGEECDDGNMVDDDACANDCTVPTPAPYCGDGNMDAGEECDDGNMVDDDACANDCTVPVPDEEHPNCGDGVLNPDEGETCDDGNTENGDGCTACCLLEGPV